MCRLSWSLEAWTSWDPQGLSRPVMGLLYLSLDRDKWSDLSFARFVSGNEPWNFLIRGLVGSRTIFGALQKTLPILTFMVPYIVNVFLSTTKKMQRYTVFFIVVSAVHVSSGFFRSSSGAQKLYKQHHAYRIQILSTHSLSASRYLFVCFWYIISYFRTWPDWFEY